MTPAGLTQPHSGHYVRRFLAGWVALGLCLTAAAFLLVRAGLPAPSVNVRWAPGIDDAQRTELEARFGLIGGTPLESPTWTYQLENADRSNVSALIGHPAVADTHKINRATFEVEGVTSDWEILRTALSIGFGLAAAVWLGVAVRRPAVRYAGRAKDAVTSAIAWLRLNATVERLDLSLLQRVSWWETGVGLVLGLIFLRTPLIYGPFDVEESGLGFFSSQVFYRNVFAGRWPFWLNDLGFGTPMPIGQRFDLHPPFALGNLVSLRAAVSAVWVIHVIVMTVYFRRLAAALGIGPLVRTALTACYLFSAPSMNYFHATDWLSIAVGWSLYPAVAYYLHRTVLEEGPKGRIATVRLALLGAFWVLNSHPGYLPPLALILGLYAVLIARHRTRIYGSLFAAAGLCAATSAERMYLLVSEGRFFPAALPRHTQFGYTLLEYARAAAVPFTELTDGAREPFIGVVVGLAALASVLRRSSAAGSHPAGLAFLAAAMCSLLPLSLIEPLKLFSAVWFFRDPMVFFGLLAAGVTLQREIQARHSRWPAITVALIAAQLVQQGAAMRPAFEVLANQRGPLHFYRDQQAPVGMAALLSERARTYGPRLYTSEAVRRKLRGGMSDLGIHAITDLVFFGLNPINGWFKNVSTDLIHPSWQYMHGMIYGQRDVIANQPLLDVLGIGLVLATAGDGPFPPGLVITDRQPMKAGSNDASDQQDLILLGNPQAWPRAVLLTEGAGRVRLPLRPGCDHDRALCREFTSLAQQRLPDDVRLEEEDGRYTARFPPSGNARLLFISTMYRPEWQAASPVGSLQIEPAADGFLGVTIPAGVQEVEVRFNPRARVILSWVSYGTMLALLSVFCVSTWRDRRRAPTP